MLKTNLVKIVLIIELSKPMTIMIRYNGNNGKWPQFVAEKTPSGWELVILINHLLNDISF